MEGSYQRMYDKNNNTRRLNSLHDARVILSTGYLRSKNVSCGRAEIPESYPKLTDGITRIFSSANVLVG